jgi:hypothetical protein
MNTVFWRNVLIPSSGTKLFRVLYPTGMANPIVLVHLGNGVNLR